MGALLKYLVLALVVVWLFYSPALRGRLRGRDREPQGGGRAPDRAPGRAPPDRIVPCAHCGVHLPLSDALHDIGGRTYCSEAHRLAGPRS